MVRDTSMAIAAAPMPIPPRAPVLSLCDGGEEGRVVRGTKLVVGVDVAEGLCVVVLGCGLPRRTRA
jgi:hypothetical protein